MRQKIAKILTIGSLLLSTIFLSSRLVLAQSDTLNFIDVNSGHWFDEILYLKQNNISHGFSNSLYKPHDLVDRKSLITLLVKSKYSQDEINSCIKLNGYEGKNIFADIPSTHHFAPFICMAKTKHISVGYSDMTFKPDTNVDILSATTLIMRVLDYNLDLPSNSSQGKYVTRLLEKDTYIESNLSLAITRPNLDNTIDHNKPLDRNQIAYLLYLIINNYKKACVGEGKENSYYNGKTCCDGLQPLTLEKMPDNYQNQGDCLIPQIDGFICTNCGNGICEAHSGEHICNCPQDCK